jgi:hypothetical protein
MLKKVVLITMLVGLVAILAAGAIIRTVDKTGNVAEARGLGRGQYNGEVAGNPQGLGQGRGGYGQGGGYGLPAEGVERQYPNYQEPPEEWQVYEGTVLETAEGGGDMVIVTDEGQEVTVGTGPGYMEAQGFTLQVGEWVQVRGYWDGDELKAAQVTRLSDGETIALRDQYGRPAWAGGGNRAVVEPVQSTSQVAYGQRGAGRSQASSSGSLSDTPGSGGGTGLAEVDSWVTLFGTVQSADSEALIVQVDEGQEITIEGRPWSFVQATGLAVREGDRVALTGFYEEATESLVGAGHEFELGHIENLSTGYSAQIREETGRPLWAGAGRRASW